jgi:hypothetical protein
MELTLEIWARKRPFFRLDPIMNNIWLDILKEALETLAARTDAPVAGAKLRAAVKKLAEDRGEQFPPEGMTKWSAFLASFPNDITVIPNRGSDVLVVPANRPDLQAVAIATATATATAPAFTRLRSDIFEALTRIPRPGERAVYLPETDAVLWQSGDEVAPPNAVPFPPATLEAEVDVRRQFADRDASVTDAAKDALRQAFESEGPLRQFTHTIRSYGLLQTWHLFRMSALTKRLREWAQAHGLVFREEWLGLDKAQVAPGAEGPLAAAAAGNKRGLVELAGLLTEDDIARISVPLDVVLRLLTAR